MSGQAAPAPEPIATESASQAALRPAPAPWPAVHKLRLTRTDTPVHLRADEPFAQAQPIPQAACADAALGPAAPPLVPLGALAPRDWEDYAATVVAPSTEPDPRPGRYAALARRRRRGGCPFSTTA
jgi:hypothetical protein